MSRLPLRWKLTLWSAILLFLLFIVYDAAHYIVINQWLVKQTEANIQKNMNELQSYFQEKQAVLNEEQIAQSRNFVVQVNQKDQITRILDENGVPIIVVSEGVHEDWVQPKRVVSTELTSEWHLQDHLLIIRSPLRTKQFTGTIEIISNLEAFDKLNELILLTMLIGGFIAMMISGLGGWIVAHQLLKPIQSMANTMRRIKEKGLQERVSYIGAKDEISELSTMFNDMMDDLEVSFKRQQQFVEDASHELRTPLAILEGHLSLLHRWGKEDPNILNESLHAGLQEVGRLKGIVQELLQLTRAESADFMIAETVEVSAVVHHTIKSFSAIHPDFHFHTDLAATSDTCIAIVPQHFEQILMILLDNAVKYSEEHKLIQVVGTVQTDSLTIRVIDSGIGIPDEDLPHVFNRFYRVDKARSRGSGGTGLGLSIAKRLVETYNGHIYMESKVDEGTNVWIQFPLVKDETKC
jgi:two-component system sensor histidine kinase ArlS